MNLTDATINALMGKLDNKKSPIKESREIKKEYYNKPDSEHIIWDTEIDYYNDDYMQDVKDNQYQDYIDELGEGEEPEDFETWYDSYITDDLFYQETDFIFDNLDNNILPAINNQINEDVLLLLGNYGSNYPDFRSSGAGGKLFKGTKELKNYMSNFDRCCITSDGGVLGAIFNDHDGTIHGKLYTIPEITPELLKKLGYEERVKEDYDEEDLDKYNINDLMETEFNDDLYYDNLDAHDFEEKFGEDLVPIKDTISGLAESKEIKTEDHQLYYDDIQEMSTDERHKLWLSEHEKDFENDDEFWDWAEEEFPVKEIDDEFWEENEFPVKESKEIKTEVKYSNKNKDEIIKLDKQYQLVTEIEDGVDEALETVEACDILKEKGIDVKPLGNIPEQAYNKLDTLSDKLHDVAVDIKNKANDVGTKKKTEDVAINNGFNITNLKSVFTLADDIAKSIKENNEKVTIDTVIDAIENWDNGDLSIIDVVAKEDKGLADKINSDEDNILEAENQFVGLVEDTLTNMGITVYDEYDESKEAKTMSIKSMTGCDTFKKEEGIESGIDREQFKKDMEWTEDDRPEDDGTYIIKFWETEEDRDKGNSSIAETGIKDKDEAIARAKKIMHMMDYAALEVQTADETETVFFTDGVNEDLFESKKITEGPEDEEIQVSDTKEDGFTYAKIFVDFFNNIDVIKWKNASQEERENMVKPDVDAFINKYGNEIGNRPNTLKGLYDYLENWNHHTQAKVLENEISKLTENKTIKNETSKSKTLYEMCEDIFKDETAGIYQRFIAYLVQDFVDDVDSNNYEDIKVSEADFKDFVQELVDADDMWEPVDDYVQEEVARFISEHDTGTLEESKKLKTEGPEEKDAFILEDGEFREIYITNRYLTNGDLERIQQAIDKVKEDPEYQVYDIEEALDELIGDSVEAIYSLDDLKSFEV